MKNDRFLLGILMFIIVLVVAALALYFTGGSEQAYLPEDTPEAIVHNYVLALTQSEYVKAYEYLATGEDHPTVAEFQRFFAQTEPIQNAGLRVGDAELIEDQAIVRLTVTWGSGGPFDSGYASEDSALLILEEGAWKIQQMPYPFWEYGWSNDLIRPK